MKKYILFGFLLTFNALFSQNKYERITTHKESFKTTIENLGNPLPGSSIFIIKYFAEKEGSYLFFLNEANSKTIAGLSEHPKDLYAGLYLEDHGGILEQVQFKDFAGPLSQPTYLLDYCVAMDADHNKSPEFYLTYFMESDGLDAKPLKVIVYSKVGKKYTKSKITAWIPSQPEDQLKQEKDNNFKFLPKAIQVQAEKLLSAAKKNL